MKAPAKGKVKSVRGTTTRKESLGTLGSETVDDEDGRAVRSTYINTKAK